MTRSLFAPTTAPVRFRALYAAASVLLLCAIAIANLVSTDEVNWKPGDFLVFAVMLAGLGAVIELAIRFTPGRAMRACAIALALAGFLFVWAMLAVG